MFIPTKNDRTIDEIEKVRRQLVDAKYDYFFATLDGKEEEAEEFIQPVIDELAEKLEILKAQ